jgi:ATP-dependent DNA helicase PIF1
MQPRLLCILLNTCTITAPGLPPSSLKLKVGAPIILLRTLNADKGLVNGTRLIVKTVNRFTLCATIVNGPRAGTDTYIPRIDMATADDTLPFTHLEAARVSSPSNWLSL